MSLLKLPFLIIALSLPLTSFAKKQQPTQLIETLITQPTQTLTSSEVKVQLVEQYYNSLKSAKLMFLQTNPDGTNANGILTIKRPDKIRLEYTDKIPILFIVNGKLIKYHDKSLDQTSSLPTSSTIASILTKKHFSFRDSDIDIKQINNYFGGVSIVMIKKSAPDEGEFTLRFKTSDITNQTQEILNISHTSLEGIDIKSPTGEIVKLKFFDKQENIPLKDDLFILQDSTTKKFEN